MDPSSSGLKTSTLLSSVQRNTGTDGRGGGAGRQTHTAINTPIFLKGNMVAADSPGHLHERYGHGGGVDGQVAIQINDDADVEHVDAH